jgi:3-oxoacyl-[acyl-carrier-protein] synthase III
MLFNNVSILGLAHVDAPHIITSASLEEKLAPAMEKLNLRPNIIQGLTGIKERRFWDPETQPSEVASRAAVRALEDANIDRSKIGVLISTSVCKDFIEPSVASLVHGNLRLGSDCLNFDISNACLAFLTGMEVAGYMIDRGQIDYALVVDGEGSRYIVDKTIERLLGPDADEKMFRANFATLTLGSGAAAMVLGRSDLNPDGHKLVGGVSIAATEHNMLCLGQREEMTTDASKLLVVGVELAARTYAKAKEELGWKDKQLNELVLHQVSNNHTAKLSGALGLDTDKIFAIYPEFGNIGPAAIPITLSKTLEAGRVSKGDRIALMGIGSGLNCAMMEVIW